MSRGKLYDPDGHYLGQVNNFYTRLGEFRMTLELDNGSALQFNPGELLRDAQGNWHVRSAKEHVLDSLRYANWADRMMAEAIKKEKTDMTVKLGMPLYTGIGGKATLLMGRAAIKKVIINPPDTIVFWSDNTKTVVKCSDHENFDPEKGLAMAVAKRAANNSPEFYKEIRKWAKESGYVQPVSSETVEKPKEKTQKACAPELSPEKLKKVVENAKEHYDKLMQAASEGNIAAVYKQYIALGAALYMIEYLTNE